LGDPAAGTVDVQTAKADETAVAAQQNVAAREKPLKRLRRNRDYADRVILNPPVDLLGDGGGAVRAAALAERRTASANRSQNSKSRIIPDCGHLVLEEAPDELRDLLLPFLDNSNRGLGCEAS
jgi:pimeloyl-ACP methyl ester carboxylesterase